MDHVGDQGTLVEYGINGLDKTATGAAEKFIDGGDLKRSQYIHRVRKKTSGNLLLIDHVSYFL